MGKDYADRPLAGFCVLGHRGAMGHAPENTIASFAKAIELKADMTELDVHLSKDGELIVIHDASVERTTDGKGTVAELDLAYIKTLDAGSWFATQFAQERVPTLREVMEFVKGYIVLNIEVKAGPAGGYAGIMDKILAEIEALNMAGNVLISSFHRPYLIETRQKAPHIDIALIYSKPIAEPWREAEEQGWDLHPHLSLVDEELVRQAHKRGILVRAWNPNEAEPMRPLVALGVDGVGTNNPEILQQVWSEYHRKRGAAS